MDDAIAGITTENFTEGDNTKGSAILVGFLVMKGNIANFDTTSTARIYQASTFRGGGAGGGGGSGGGGATLPAGSSSYVQFNDVGSFGADSRFTFDKITHTLTVTGTGSFNQLSTGPLTASVAYISGSVGIGTAAPTRFVEAVNSINGTLGISIKNTADQANASAILEAVNSASNGFQLGIAAPLATNGGSRYSGGETFFQANLASANFISMYRSDVTPNGNKLKFKIHESLGDTTTTALEIGHTASIFNPNSVANYALDIKANTIISGTLTVTGSTTLSTVSGTTAQFTLISGSTISASNYVGLPASTPGGTNTTIQFNSGSTFSGSSNLIYDYTTNTLSGTTAQFTAITGTNVYFSGSVGVGKTNPNSTFDVSGNTIISGNLNVTGSTTLSTVSGTTAQFAIISGSAGLIQGDLRVLGTASIAQLNTIGQTSLLVGDKYITILSGGVDHPGIDGAGFLWGSSSGPGETTGALGEHAHVLYNATRDALQIFPGLYVLGNASVSGNLVVTGSIVELSTRKIKTNIQTVSNQLTTISKLNPVSYVRLDDGRKEYGFISEEVKEVYPEFVVGEGINYPKMVSVLVSAVKELTDKVEKQQNEIELLKNKKKTTRGKK